MKNFKSNSHSKCTCMIPYYFARNEYNISDICYYAEISRQSFYNYLDNKQLPSVHTARLICNYFEDISNEKFAIEDLWKYEPVPYGEE